MKRSLELTLALCSVLAMTGPVHARSGSDEGRISGQAAGTAMAAQGGASSNASATATADADAGADYAKLKQQVESRGARISAASRARVEARLEAAAKSTDDAGAKGGAAVTNRLAREFGVTTWALAEERTELGVSWGQLMIAHTLAANARTQVAVQQLFELRKEGMGWGQIAAGLGFNLGEVVSAVNAEGRAARGEARADGKVAAIHGNGARSGLGMDAGAGAGLGAGRRVGVGAGAVLGVGIKAGH